MGLEISVLALFLFGGWFWVDSMRVREVALEAGRRACAAEGVQFLDWTVAVVKIRIARSVDGRLRLRRIYEFEFSDTGIAARILCYCIYLLHHLFQGFAILTHAVLNSKHF